MKRFQVGPARLRNGWEARVYAIDGGGDYPVHGAYRCPGSDKWIAITRHADGTEDQGAYEYDLLPNATPVVSDAALDAYYDARGWGRRVHSPRDATDNAIAACLAPAFAVMLAEQGE